MQAYLHKKINVISSYPFYFCVLDQGCHHRGHWHCLSNLMHNLWVLTETLQSSLSLVLGGYEAHPYAPTPENA
ncbi:hypothetical protein VIMY103929_00900 [Vibrio mytili]